MLLPAVVAWNKMKNCPDSGLVADIRIVMARMVEAHMVEARMVLGLELLGLQVCKGGGEGEG